MKQATSMSLQHIGKYRKDFRDNRMAQTMAHAIAKNGVDAVAFNQETLRNLPVQFSLEIETGAITNQKASGRCWIFAGLNMLRYHIGQKIKWKDFELSQNYVAFWDKFEKANYFLEAMIDTADQALSERTVMWLIQTMVNDGGQWDMFCNIVQKYGIVPKSAMPETEQSSASAQMNRFLQIKLREYAHQLRQMIEKKEQSDAVRVQKEAYMSDIYALLCLFLGEPPQTFDFEYKDDDKNFQAAYDLTPQRFFEIYVKKNDINVADYVSLIHAPTKDKPFWNTYTVQYLGNVIGGNDVRYLNLPIEHLKDVCIRQIKDDLPVWFGCDVGKMFVTEHGLLDPDAFAYEKVLNTTFIDDKAFRLDYHMSLMTHAMVFTGVNIKDGTSTRWKVENSWGDKRGHKGFLIMSDAWYDAYVYQVVVHKFYLDEEMIKALEKEPIVLKPWDPMGSLA